MTNNIFYAAPLPWRRRHPILFWLGIIVLLWLILSIARGVYLASQPGGPLSGPYFGVVHVEGVIMDSRPVLEWIEALEKDKNAVGVLVRIESPGGAVTPSEEIYTALARLAASRPVVASLGAMAASGGYMAALPARAIVANPTTLTGSVGVRMELPNMQGLMGKIGITHEALASGDLKAAGSPFSVLTDKERAYFMALVQDMFERFVDMVKKHRRLTPEALATISDGRAVTGRQALDLGLVDSLGDQPRALNVLKELCQVKEDLPLLEGPEKENYSLLRLVLGEAVFNNLSKVLERLSLEAEEPGVVRFYY